MNKMFKTGLMLALVLLVLSAGTKAENNVKKPEKNDEVKKEKTLKRSDLKVPEHLWNKVLANTGVTENKLGYNADQMAHVTGFKHILPIMKKLFRNILKIPDYSGYISDLVLNNYDNPDALVHLMKQDFWNQVKRLLGKLSKMEREVFILRFMDYLSIKEISQVIKKSESTVKTHLHRALQKFRKEPSIIQFLRETQHEF